MQRMTVEYYDQEGRVKFTHTGFIDEVLTMLERPYVGETFEDCDYIKFLERFTPEDIWSHNPGKLKALQRRNEKERQRVGAVHQ